MSVNQRARLSRELRDHIDAFHDVLPQAQGETGDGGMAGKALCQWVYDNAEAIEVALANPKAEPVIDALEEARGLIQAAKGAEGPNGGFVTDHLDFAEQWLDRAEDAVAGLIDALEFYANGIGHTEIEDGGERARTAIAKARGEA